MHATGCAIAMAGRLHRQGVIRLSNCPHQARSGDPQGANPRAQLAAPPPRALKPMGHARRRPATLCAPPLPYAPEYKRHLQLGSDAISVAVTRERPAACPTHVAEGGPWAGPSTAVDCRQSGGVGSAQVDVGDVCTAERTWLYLWVVVKGSDTVSGLGTCATHYLYRLYVVQLMASTPVLQHRNLPRPANKLQPSPTRSPPTTLLRAATTPPPSSSSMDHP